jgi:hypothetical protein
MKLAHQHVELARTISAVVRSGVAIPDRTSDQEVQVAIAAKPNAINVGS